MVECGLCIGLRLARRARTTVPLDSGDSAGVCGLLYGEPLTTTLSGGNLPSPSGPLVADTGDGRAPVNDSRSRGAFSFACPLGSGSGAQLVSGSRSDGSMAFPWKSMILVCSLLL